MDWLIALSLPILLLPLLSFVLQIFLGKRVLGPKGAWISVGILFICLALSLTIFFNVVVQGNPNGEEMLGVVGGKAVHQSTVWFTINDAAAAEGNGRGVAQWGILIDHLTAVMLVVVTLVSALVHLYSVGYMAHEEHFERFFGYLGIFTFSMLILVLGDNLFLLFIGWEMVGLSSYLLIGFFYTKKSAAAACKKAFVTNRIGDFFFLIAIMMIWNSVYTLDYVSVFGAAQNGEWNREGILGLSMMTIIAIGLFGGAVGKSAQFPLHVWLPDAMEGPTPVSALIHAATMVAAGVYLLGRLYPLFPPEALLVVAVIGLITAIVGALIAITQTDIKRVLAYSTISQLGYMVTAMGVGAVTAGLFHLMTHAAFKACLFLCSGSVIHAVHSQEMPEMGGLRKKMPITYWTMLLSTLAICGIPFFSGFYSKDAIILGAALHGLEGKGLGYLFYIGLLLGAGITAFYMFRLIFLTFFGEPRVPEKHAHAHESPWTMTVPLIVLAALAIGCGWFWQSWFAPNVQPISYEEILATPTAHGEASDSHGGHLEHTAHTMAMFPSILIVLLGIAVSYLFYGRKSALPETWTRLMGPAFTLSLRKFFFDEIYEQTVVRLLHALSKLGALCDRKVIDFIVNGAATLLCGLAWVAGKVGDALIVDNLGVNGVARATRAAGSLSTLLQSGVIQNYALKVLSAVAVMLLAHNIIIKLIG